MAKVPLRQYFDKWVNQTHIGDARRVLRKMAKDSVEVQTVVTSPPYYGLRDYKVKGQIGLEKNLGLWVRDIVDTFDAVHAVLAKSGTVWLNLGDAYSSSGGAGWQGKHGVRSNRSRTQRKLLERPWKAAKVRPKNLMGQAWRVALALQEAGWFLRCDIIWRKPNPMPESVKDRPTRCHEYLFLLSKSPRYYYDWEAIQEPASPDTHARYARGRSDAHKNADGGPTQQTISGSFEHMIQKNPFQKPIAGWAETGDHSALGHAQDRGSKDGTKLGRKKAKRGSGVKNNESMDQALMDMRDMRNKRSVWDILPDRSPFAHFATFPLDLVHPCVLAGTKPGQIVLDPFMGSGTTAQAAVNLGRHYIGVELNPKYVEFQKQYRDMTMGMGI